MLTCWQFGQTKEVNTRSNFRPLGDGWDVENGGCSEGVDVFTRCSLTLIQMSSQRKNRNRISNMGWNWHQLFEDTVPDFHMNFQSCNS